MPILVVDFYEGRGCKPTRPAVDYDFLYSFVDKSLVGKPEEKSSTRHYRIIVSISNERFMTWDKLEYRNNDSWLKILYEFAKRYVSEKMKNGELLEYDELKINTQNSPQNICPYDPKQIPPKGQWKFDVFIAKTPESQDHKRLELRNLKEGASMPLVKVTPKLSESFSEQFPQSIFISHSSRDANYAKAVVELLESIGISSIFCSSVEGYSIPLGKRFLDYIKEELNKDTLLLFLVSDNFYKSPICLCEMGAAWVKEHRFISILIPPFEYGELKGIIEGHQAFKINDIEKLASFYDVLTQSFKLSPNTAAWQRKVARFLKEIEPYIKSSEINTAILKILDVVPEFKQVLSGEIDSYAQHIWTSEVDTLRPLLAQLDKQGYIDYTISDRSIWSDPKRGTQSELTIVALPKLKKFTA